MFNGTLADGTYKVKVAGGTVQNAIHNTLDAASASFVVAMPVITGISANPTSFNSAGGSATVEISGSHLTGQTLKVYVDSIATATVNVISATSATATVTLPRNTTANAKTYRLTVELNGMEVAGQSATLTVAREASTVTYDGNGATSGQVPVDTNKYEKGDNITVAGNPGKLEKTGHTFTGWTIQSDGQGTVYTDGDPFPMGAANVTLYAQWTANPTYTITYDENGATSGQVPSSASYEETATVTVQGNNGNLVKLNHTFTGWNTEADGKGTGYAENTTFQMGTANITLYAQWKANPPTTGGDTTPPPASSNNDDDDDDYSPPTTVKITWHSNGGTMLESMDITYNTKVSDLPVPTRAGFRFDGWYEDEALTKRWTEEILVRENISLYAKWTVFPAIEPELETPQEPQLPKSKPTVTFDDINQHWAKEMIEELATLGIIQGYEDGTFRPNTPISRMHVAALLTRAFPFENVRATKDFSDVSPAHPYYEAILTLQQAGIIDGTNGAFLPKENMTRAELAKILVGVLGLTPEGTASFSDVASTHWSTGYIAVLEREGIALGDNGEYRPNDPVTRAQFVTFLYRIINL